MTDIHLFDIDHTLNNDTPCWHIYLATDGSLYFERTDNYPCSVKGDVNSIVRNIKDHDSTVIVWKNRELIYG